MAIPRKTKIVKNKRKTSHKKQNDTNKYTCHIFGFIGILLVITAIGKFGIVGVFLANIMRWIVGDTYQLFLILIMIILGGLAIYGKMPVIKFKNFLGISLLYMGITLIGSIKLFNKLNQHQYFLKSILKFIEQDLNNNLVRTPVGGGSLGAVLLSITYAALSNWGSWIVAIALLIGGIVILFKLPIKDLMNSFFYATEYTANKVGDSTRVAVEVSTKKIAELNENYKKHRSNVASEVFKDNFKVKNDENVSTKKVVDSPFSDKQFEGKYQNSNQSSIADKKFVMPEIVAPNDESINMQTVNSINNDFKYQVDQETGEILDYKISDDYSTFNDSNKKEKIMPDIFDESKNVNSGDKYFKNNNYSNLDNMNGLDAGNESDSEELIRRVDLVQSNANLSPKYKKLSEEYHSIPESKMEINVNKFESKNNVKLYELPDVSILTKAGSTDQSKEKNQLTEKSRILQQTLESFNIRATVEKVVLGPTITQYEIKPAVGVKVSKITNLSDDLAMALAAKSLRIEAPIPGKSLVGIEVANEQQAMVGFRNMFEQFRGGDKILEVPIGKSVNGEIVKMDLTKMPHLLIAGSTGSGKSVAINTILAAILLQAKPEDLKLMLVDPKKVELSIYNDIPHLITPVVSEPRKAAAALKKVVVEMDKRFDKLSEIGARNIEGYNKIVDGNNDQNYSQFLHMPYLVVIIDELADLMITVSQEVEPAIVRIAQLGRAAGIHLIVATQRPSVDVITGLIKANVPSRMAFAVGSGTDSRTILDSNGAEKLLGRGDMLFKPIGSNSPERVQSAFISDNDVEVLTNFIKKQGNAQYDQNMEITDDDLQSFDEKNEIDNNKNMLDEIWDDALDFAASEGEISASMMQRHFRMGYNRAARLVDDMESQGVIGSANGGKRRPVILTKEQWYERMSEAKNK